MTGTSVGRAGARVSPASARTGSCGRERPTLRGPCGHHTCPRSHTSTAGEAAPALRLPGLPAPTAAPPGLRGLPRLQLPRLWVLCWFPGPHFRPRPGQTHVLLCRVLGSRASGGGRSLGPIPPSGNQRRAQRPHSDPGNLDPFRKPWDLPPPARSHPCSGRPAPALPWVHAGLRGKVVVPAAPWTEVKCQTPQRIRAWRPPEPAGRLDRGAKTQNYRSDLPEVSLGS
ncbi:uncharacterized protein LOC119865455 isoform X2 [Canis lupus familiaris]|uniref:uncharacterized protein LOC119865455 isoform X2 n=1 Tax=Canis lupus familiaris TaxID=9615 RepID=UPI0018F63961|nr:uncharacterized protein LOC119865455 isoform X2 [Canis lupus familiaris]XP_038313188.1 uncharacterized protein LOC119865455 isoform X2 [Canis lupus familiaris]